MPIKCNAQIRFTLIPHFRRGAADPRWANIEKE